MSVPPTIEVEALLSEDRWMRRLARRLVRDREAAEDLAQEAWVAALSSRRSPESPRGRPRALRPWLRGVLRHLGLDRHAAGEARAHRERRAARDEALASTDELVSELELRQRVATALLELGEPERRTLTLRFFRDLTLREIAEREGVSVTAIHERIERGLARLRARLDRDHGGRREGWVPGLLALAGHGKWTWMTEALAMGTGLKVAASTLVVGGGLLVAWIASDERAATGRPAAVVAAEAPAPDALEPEPRVETPRTVERERAAVPAPPSRTLPAAPGSPVRLLHGRVVDPRGNGLRAIELGWTPDARTSGAAVTAFSDGAGAFALVRPDPDADGQRWVTSRSPDFVTLVPGSGERDGALVVVAPRASFAGEVVDPAGTPVARATVTMRLRDALFRRLGLMWGGPEPANWTTRTDEQGRFEPLSGAGGEFVYLAVEADGFAPAEVPLLESGDGALRVTLQPLERGVLLAGFVVGSSGDPIEGARVSTGDDIATTDADGRFELHVDPRPGPDDERWIVAVQRGFAPARERLASLDLAAPVTLRLDGEPASIEGRVIDQDEAPWRGAVVWASDPSPFGNEVRSVAEGATLMWSTTVEEVLTGTHGPTGVRTDDEGHFRLDGLLPRDYVLHAFDPLSMSRSGPWTIGAGSGEVELVLPRGELTPVAGRVVSSAGAPIAGVSIHAQRVRGPGAPGGASAYYHEPPQSLLHFVETDDEGRFAFEGLDLAHVQLVLHHPRLFLQTVSIADEPDPEHLELVQALHCELQVDLRGAPDLADAIEVLDAEGTKLETIESFGTGWAMDTSATFRDGLTGVLMVPETARTLVLLRDGVEVHREPLGLDPGRLTTVRP